MGNRFFIILMIAILQGAGAAEFSRGPIKLVIREDEGNFSLYTMTEEGRYEALFTDQDPRSSFLMILLNGKSYKLGESPMFKAGAGGTPQKPAIIFSGDTLEVTEEFSFLENSSAQVTGIRIDVLIKNLSFREQVTGYRFLLDTSLGERPGKPHFETDTMLIARETVVRGAKPWSRWVSRNDKLCLMGSIMEGDTVIFANWKRLSAAQWKTDFNGTFSQLPYSIDDSAVCYAADPIPLAPEGTIAFSVLLASGGRRAPFFRNGPAGEEIRGFLHAGRSSDISNISREKAVTLIEEMIAMMEDPLYGGFVTDGDYAAMESLIQRLNTRFGFR